jgi:large subunit ribosomal protein L7/L12
LKFVTVSSFLVLLPDIVLIDVLFAQQAKKFVESVPKVVKENVPKEEAEKLKATFEALGAIVTME